MPNLLRALVADAALSSAFVPVFTELLEQRRKQDAFALAGALFGLILVVLGAITVVFILIAPLLMPLFIGDTFTPELVDLTVGLSQVLFPIVVLLGLNGLVVGHPAGLRPLHDPGARARDLEPGDHRGAGDRAPQGHRQRTSSTGTPAASWPGPRCSSGMCFPVLRRVGFHLRISLPAGTTHGSATCSC